jgi:phosphatidylinositol kinase/protein kinase (PI-3  family)
MLTNYPKMKIEQVPFKLTEEMMDLLGGENS